MNASSIHASHSIKPLPYIYYARVCRQSQQHQQDDDDDVSIEYQIEKIQAHRLKSHSPDHQSHSPDHQSAWQMELLQMPLQQIPNSELQFLVKWIGHEERSWQPGQNLKNAPQILESYKQNYHRSKAMSAAKPYTGRPRGRKPKNGLGKGVGCSKGEFDFGKVFKKEEDEIQIIGKEDYMKATRQFSRSIVVEPFIKRVPQQKNQPAEGNKLELAVQPSSIHIPEPVAEKMPIVHEQPRDNQSSLVPINEAPSNVGNCQDNQEANARRVHQQSVMLTQEERNIVQQQNTVKMQLMLIEEQRDAKGNFLEQSLSQGDRLIDLFIQTQKKHPHQIEQLPPIEHERVFWPENEYFMDESVNDGEAQLQALERLSHIQEKQQVVDLPKRAFREQGHEGVGEMLSKKIKQDEPLVPPIFKQYGIYHKQQNPIEIEIEDKDPQLYQPEPKPLKQQIEREVNTLLVKGKDNIEDILQIQPRPSIPLKPRQSCAQCKIHEQYNEQLRLLFSEYIQNNQELNIDNIFLQQQTFSVLSTLNPASFNQSNFLRVDKMADITDKEPLCTLISRKIATRQEIEWIIKDFNPSKLVKIRNEWLCILKADSLGEGRQEHFKYVRANQLIQVSRKTVVSFLIN